MVNVIPERSVSYGGMLAVSPDLIEQFCTETAIPNPNSADGDYDVAGLLNNSEESSRNVLNANIGKFIMGFYGTNPVRLDDADRALKLSGAGVLDWVADEAFKNTTRILPNGVVTGSLRDVQISAVLDSELPANSIPTFGTTRRREIHFDDMGALFRVSGILPKHEGTAVSWVIATRPTITVASRVGAKKVEIDQHVETKTKIVGRQSLLTSDPTRRGRVSIGPTRTGGTAYRNWVKS